MDKTKETIEVFNNAADRYHEKFSVLDIYNDTYDLLLSLIEKPNAKVLELGCGPGNITNYLLKKRRDLNILGTDLAPNMLKIASETNPPARFELLDCRDIWKLKENFDVIVTGFCFPYLPKEEVEQLIEDSYLKLEPGGLLYFSVIEDNYEKSAYEYSSDGKNKCYVYYYTENYLSGVLQQNNFLVKRIFRKQFHRGETKQTQLIYIASK